jgi:(4S)-4-hydroxy-5-phosphonooxypentane-2,3-dione isomerase
MICMLVEVHIKPAAVDEFLELMTHDATVSVRDEPGCLRFDIMRDNDDPCKFFFSEVYRDEAARLAHRETPHFAIWMEFAGRGLDREPVRHATTVVHPPVETWR